MWNALAVPLAVLLAAATLGGATYVAFRLGDRWLTIREHADARANAEEARRVTEWTAEHEAEEQRRALLLKDAEMASRLSTALPEDIVAVINEESEQWYREEREADYRRRYVQLGDWNAVRASIGIGTIDGEVA